jgi:PST family polysaccharide transporter
MSLARKAVRGAFWTISSGIGARAIGLIGTLIVTRFVAPSDYGEVSVAAVLVLTANQFSTLGLGQYLIANPDAGRSAGFHATLYHVVLGVLVLGALLPFGHLFAPLLDAPGATLYLPGLVLAALLDRVGFVPERILVRDLRFGLLSAARSGSDLAFSVVSVALAALGWGAMAIVVGNLVRALLRNSMFVLAVERRDWLEPGRPKLEVSRRMFAFGLPLSGAALAAFASRRWDHLLVSSFFGPAPAGMYNLAYNLADVPAVQVGEQIGDVLLPSFARLDAERRKRALIQALTLLSLIVFPLAVGLGAIAPTLVHVLFDERWAPVAPMLVLLSALSITRPVGWTVASYLQARQLPRSVLWLELFKLGSLLGFVFTIGRLSPVWTSAAVGIAFAAHTLACLWVVQRVDGMTLASLLTSIVPALVACIPLVAAVFGVRWLASSLGYAVSIPLLLVEMLAGAIGYVGAALLFARRPSEELLHRLRDAMARATG